jgi:hypothetical protein
MTTAPIKLGDDTILCSGKMRQVVSTVAIHSHTFKKENGGCAFRCPSSIHPVVRHDTQYCRRARDKLSDNQVLRRRHQISKNGIIGYKACTIVDCVVSHSDLCAILIAVTL